MSTPSRATKHYASAQKRLLEASIAHFFAENFPSSFGPTIRARIAEALLALIEEQSPARAQLHPGQCVWNAVALDTRADSPHLRLVPVILTLVDKADIQQLADGAAPPQIAQTAIARRCDEAYQQGGLLSMRDLGLLTWREPATISHYRQNWEAAHGRILPHPGSLQDMGTCVTHKTAIVVKAVYEKKDPRQVARETHHSQKAVDRYLSDFYRVRTCYRANPDQGFICQVTGMSAHLVQQYLTIIEKYEQTPLTGNSA
jgi:hypothetical protein